MKILLITNEFNYCSGVTTYIVNLASGLKQDNTICVVTSGGTALELISKLNVKLKIIKEINYHDRSYLNFFIGILKLSYFLIKNKFELVHSNDHYTSNIARFAKVISRIPIVQTVHSNFFHTNKLKKYSADYYIFVNKHMFDSAVLEFPNIKGYSEIVFNGIDYNKKYNEIKVRNDSKLCLSVAARLEYDKGIQNVIKAISILPANYKMQLDFKIAGTGSLENDLKNLCKKLNVKAEFLGEVKDIDYLLSTTDIFVFSSLYDSFGLTLLEAIKYNCFIIASNFTGVEYIFKDNIDGFIFDKDSFESLKEKIMHAIDLGIKRNFYIKNFKEKAVGKFNLTQMYTQTIKVYNRCLQSKKLPF